MAARLAPHGSSSPTPAQWRRIVAWVAGAMLLALALAWWVSIGAP